MKLAVLYEDMDIVAVNKPSGLLTHADGRSSNETVADWFVYNYPEAKNVGESQKLTDGTLLQRPGIVHRLDTDTSGVLVLAKTQQAHERLKTAFQKHEIQKTYIACIYGVPKAREGDINFPIGRSRKDFRLRSAQPRARGVLREAHTHYSVIADNGTHALVKLTPTTGRTHQLRAHLKAIHHPIVCDPLYAQGHSCDLGVTRLALHAYEIEIPILSTDRIVVTAPIPPDIGLGVKAFSCDYELVYEDTSDSFTS